MWCGMVCPTVVAAWVTKHRRILWTSSLIPGNAETETAFLQSQLPGLYTFLQGVGCVLFAHAVYALLYNVCSDTPSDTAIAFPCFTLVWCLPAVLSVLFSRFARMAAVKEWLLHHGNLSYYGGAMWWWVAGFRVILTFIENGGADHQAQDVVKAQVIIGFILSYSLLVQHWSLWVRLWTFVAAIACTLVTATVFDSPVPVCLRHPMWALLSGLLLACHSWVTAKEKRNLFLANRQLQRMRQAAERQTVTVREASEEADSVLNHTLKNTMANAAGELALFLDENSDSGRVSDSDRQRLDVCVGSLRRGMRSCRHREVYIELAAGTYCLEPCRVKLEDFLQQLTQGLNIAVTIRVQDTNGCFDVVLLSLILDNAISNAHRHGHPQNLDLRLEVSEGDDGRIIFQLTNIANPASTPLCKDFLGSRASGRSRPQHEPGAVRGISFGLGVRHICMAAEAASIEVSLQQGGSLVTFRAAVPVSNQGADEPEPELEAPPEAVDVSAFPKGLCVVCIDDSKICLRILKSSLEHITERENVFAYGDEGPADVPLFLEKALASADIAILDQHLDWPGACHQGDELVRQLISDGFRGLLGIRSGNTSKKDVKRYRKAGCHFVLGKELASVDFLRDIKEAYLKHRNATPSSDMPIPSSSGTQVIRRPSRLCLDGNSTLTSGTAVLDIQRVKASSSSSQSVLGSLEGPLNVPQGPSSPFPLPPSAAPPPRLLLLPNRRFWSAALT